MKRRIAAPALALTPASCRPIVSGSGSGGCRSAARTGMARRAGAVKVIFAATALLALGACAAPSSAPPASDSAFLEQVPPQVAAMAAPHQNLQAVRLMRSDGCYWYQHVGPVETTMLPLRTSNGSRICTAS